MTSLGLDLNQVEESLDVYEVIYCTAFQAKVTAMSAYGWIALKEGLINRNILILSDRGAAFWQ